MLRRSYSLQAWHNCDVIDIIILHSFHGEAARRISITLVSIETQDIEAITGSYFISAL